jgi:hypothetical protein
MKRAILMAGIAAAAIRRGGEGRGASDYELAGLPITSHQVAVLAGADIREQSAVPALTLRDMPASPSQIAILTPRQRVTSMATVGSVSK